MYLFVTLLVNILVQKKKLNKPSIMIQNFFILLGFEPRKSMIKNPAKNINNFFSNNKITNSKIEKFHFSAYKSMLKSRTPTHKTILFKLSLTTFRVHENEIKIIKYDRNCLQ
jgi:hypothetical protein